LINADEDLFLTFNYTETLDVLASPKWPKADGIACPKIARYNDHKTTKGKDAPVSMILRQQYHPEASHPCMYGYCIKISTG